MFNCPKFPSTVRNRADLLVLLSQQGSNVPQTAWADLCGYEPRRQKREKSKKQKLPDSGEQTNGISLTRGEPEAERERLGFWRMVKSEISGEEPDWNVPEWFRKAEPVTRQLLRNAKRPAENRPFPLLSPWPRLWPFLRKELSTRTPGGKVDAKSLVKDIARYRLIRKIPRRMVNRWSRTIHVLCDTSDALNTFYHDYYQVIRRIQMICGRHRIKLFNFPYGLADICFDSKSDDFMVYRIPEQPTSILTLGDLGIFTGDVSIRKWAIELSRAMARFGCRPIVLTPCPPRRWPRDLVQSWRMAWWERGKRPNVLPLRAFDPKESDRDEPEYKTEPQPVGLKHYLCLMSPVVSHDPELIRYIRSLLPVEATDSGMEADIWLFRYDYMAKLPEFAPVLGHEKCLRLVKLLNWFHGDYPDILAEEITNIQTVYPDLPPEIASNAETFNAKLARSLDDLNWQAQGFSSAEFMGYLGRREERLPEAAYRNERVAASWVLAHRSKDGKLEMEEVPRELPLNKVAWALKTGKRRYFRLIQVEQDLVAMHEGTSGTEKNVNPVGHLLTSSDFVLVKMLDEVETSKRRWRLSEPNSGLLSSKYSAQKFEIETTDHRIELEQITRPAWAKEMGRDRQGLYALLHDDRCFYWLNPGRYTLRESTDESMIVISEGCWLLKKKYQAYLASGILMLDWREHLGEDEFGLYEVIIIRGVKQMFRWIPPGRFQMGSPEEEPERREDESLHEVKISQGFWMADTACTQSLWQAVMDENPSRFKGESRPVEGVSWEDCQAFIDRINQECPELSFVLPTEAQWEYACRAGTTTPFWFGNDINTDQVNYNGHFPYVGVEKGENRRETVPVKTLPPNNWGLYEMHGNVWEWCSDWYDYYKDGSIADPNGPEIGGYRVLRGGSWNGNARDCRSADRYGYDPAFRVDFSGFRLSLARRG